MKRITIGIASGRKYENYLNWFLQLPDIKVIKLSHFENNFESISACDGVVLSGGEDIHPRFYKKPEYLREYDLHDIDEQRDDFEMRLLSFAEEKQIPLLGVCRGLQMANVFFGGTLIPDIPSFRKPDHSKFKQGEDRYHNVEVRQNSLLASITGSLQGEVNSAHHQSVDLVGKGLLVNARSPEGIVEGLERTERAGKSYLLLVQWHPERMTNPESLFSKGIRDSFLEGIRSRTN